MTFKEIKSESVLENRIGGEEEYGGVAEVETAEVGEVLPLRERLQQICYTRNEDEVGQLTKKRGI